MGSFLLQIGWIFQKCIVCICLESIWWRYCCLSVVKWVKLFNQKNRNFQKSSKHIKSNTFLKDYFILGFLVKVSANLSLIWASYEFLKNYEKYYMRQKFYGLFKNRSFLSITFDRSKIILNCLRVKYLSVDYLSKNTTILHSLKHSFVCSSAWLMSIRVQMYEKITIFWYFCE